MDWKYWVTTIVALWAAWIAYGARKEAKKASSATFEFQRRAEQYLHFPLVSVTVMPDGDRVKVMINNTSDTKSVLDYKARFVLRIKAGSGEFSVDSDKYCVEGGVINPNTSVAISSKEIDDSIANALPFLKAHPQDQNQFVLRVYAECSPPHKNSEKIIESGAGHFIYEQGVLKLVPPPSGS